MLWLVVLSFNAVYTLIPIIIIVILIGAGAGLSRNTDFFALMGFGTIIGAARPGGGRVGKGFGSTKYGGSAGKRASFKKKKQKKGQKTRVQRAKGQVKNIIAKHVRNVNFKKQAKANLGIKAANAMHNANPNVKKPATMVPVAGMKNAALTALTLGRINMATSHAGKLKGKGPQTQYGVYGQKMAGSKAGKDLLDARNARNAAVKKLNESYRKQVDFKESLINKKDASGKPKELSDIFKDSAAKSEELKNSLAGRMLNHPVIFGAVSLPGYLAVRHLTEAGKQRGIDRRVEKNEAIVAKKIRKEENARADANYMLFKSSMPSKKEARTAFKNEYKKLKSEYANSEKAAKEVNESKKAFEVDQAKSQSKEYYKNMTWKQKLEMNAKDRWNYNKAPIFKKEEGKEDKQLNPSILGSHYENKIKNIDESQINKLNERLNTANSVTDINARDEMQKEALGIAMLSKRKQKKYERLEEKEKATALSTSEQKDKAEIGQKAAAIVDRHAKATAYQFHPEYKLPPKNTQTGTNQKQPKMDSNQFKDLMEKRDAEAKLKAKEYSINMYKKQQEKIEKEKQDIADEERRQQEEKAKKAQKKSGKSGKP